jgi:hypothetical protein
MFILLLSCQTLLIIILHAPHGKHHLMLSRLVFTVPLPSNGCPIAEHLCCGNVLESLPSNGYTCHNIIYE